MIDISYPHYPHLHSPFRHTEELQKHVLEYKAPVPCNRLPTLTFIDTESMFRKFVGDRTWPGTTGEIAKSKEPLRYIDISPPDDMCDYSERDFG